MAVVDYTDEDGFKYKVEVPEGGEAFAGKPIGPPDLSSLGLPYDMQRALHNELFYRGIIKASDAKMKRSEVQGALQQVLSLDVEHIVQVYLGVANEQPVVVVPVEEQKEVVLPDARPRRRVANA